MLEESQGLLNIFSERLDSCSKLGARLDLAALDFRSTLDGCLIDPDSSNVHSAVGSLDVRPDARKLEAKFSTDLHMWR